MTLLEKQIASINKEIEKYNKSLETHAKRLEKKILKCESKNCNWSEEEFFQHRDVDMTPEQWPLYFDKSLEEDHIKEINESLENAYKRLAKLQPHYKEEIENQEQEQKINDIQNSLFTGLKLSIEEQEAAYKKWLEEFKAECLKDGIIIYDASNNYFSGLTKQGQKFYMYINNGWTERSFHSYTLKVNGNTIFTSGLFSTGYKYIANL